MSTYGYNRKKTGTLARVKLLPEALELMAKYEDEARDTLFPLLSTNRVRIDLITICRLAETSKTYSYHVSSHSKFFYLLNISELSILKNVTANDLETSYILFLSQLCNIQRTL